jgi:ATP-binding cassette subfamily F protein uup
LVVEARNIGYRWNADPIIQDFSTTILRGDKVGLIGPNGAGKSTLLNLLLGRIPPESGQLRLGTRLTVAYFDQMRSQLRDDKSVQDNVAGGADHVQVFGKTKHVIGYLQDFLFAPERARTPVRALSGGERNRLLLARLFARPANVLVLDEPTNDLDSETLELLEDLLVEYTGTLLLVSHDRAFLDHVVTSCLVFEGGGTVREYVGGYDDWVRQRSRTAPAGKTVGAKRETRPPTANPHTGQRKLGYKEQRELDSLPAQIEAVETELETLQSAMATADFYQQEGGEIAAAKSHLGLLQSRLRELYLRWEELEAVAR